MHPQRHIRLHLAIAASAIALPSFHASASQLTYAPVNPIFQPGNPVAGTLLLQSAEAQRKKEPIDPTTGISQRSIAETVKAAFLSRLTSDIFTQVFGEDAANSGSFDLGDGNLISFIRAGGNVTITFVDPINGETIITVPDTL